MGPHEHPGLHLKVRPGADGLHVEVTGDLDLRTADHLVHAITTELPQQDPTLFLDLSGVDFCGSAGVSALLQVRRHQHDLGKRLHLARLTDHVRRVLLITGVLPSLSVLVEQRRPHAADVVDGDAVAKATPRGAAWLKTVQAQTKIAKAWTVVAPAQAQSARARTEIARVRAAQAAQQVEQVRTQARQRRGPTVEQVAVAEQLAKIARERAELARRSLATARRAAVELMSADTDRERPTGSEYRSNYR